MITKPIKIKVDFLGVNINAVFMRGKHRYECKISEYTAKRCYKAALKALEKGLPRETCVSAECSYFLHGKPSYKARLNRHVHKPDGTFLQFVLSICEWNGSEYFLTADHEWFDWLLARRKTEIDTAANYLAREAAAIEDKAPFLIGCEG